MTIKPWKKVGDATVLLQRHGRGLISQDFQAPSKDYADEYTLFSDTPAVNVFALTEEWEVITVVQYKQGVDCVAAENPAGRNDAGEDPLITARRELFEETGFTPGPLNSDLTILQNAWPHTRAGAYHITYIMATNCIKANKQKLDDNANELEKIAVELIPLKQWIKILNSGEIKDTNTIACSFLALMKLNLLRA